MPCEKPGITPLGDECCFNCYSTGRLPYGLPIAIVLHEYDGIIEDLASKVESCCDHNPGCHQSFHYGVGGSGEVLEWVDPGNTAWSFDTTDQDCSICNWILGKQQSPQDPNLYTINIAIPTGVSSIIYGKKGPKNLYTDKQYNSIVRLVGWLAETYGIVVNQNNIWRHCNELKDFPSLCPNEKTYSEFLEDVQDCIDSIPPDLAICGPFCDSPIKDGSPTFVLGADESCENCGRYELNLCSLVANLPAGVLDTLYVIGTNADGECSYLPVNMECDPTQVISSALGLNSNGVLGLYPVKEQLTHRDISADDTLTPATDRIIRIDASQNNVVFTLIAPDDCDPTDYWIKRMDCDGSNTCVVNGGGAPIDGLDEIALDTPGPFGNFGEAIHVYWDGSQWTII